MIPLVDSEDCYISTQHSYKLSDQYNENERISTKSNEYFRGNRLFNSREMCPKIPKYDENNLGVAFSNSVSVNESEVRLRRRSSIAPQTDLFIKYNVPDLVIHKIFEFLNKRDLSNAMRTCRWFYAIGSHSNFWKGFDLAGKRITEYTLCKLITRKTQSIRLMEANGDNLTSSLRLPSDVFRNILSLQSNIRHLDLSRASLEKRHLELLLKTSYNISCLSLEGHTIDADIVKYISQNESLVKLDLSLTSGITKECAVILANRCNMLQELNISWCGLTESIVSMFCRYLTKTITKLNISGTRYDGLTDDSLLDLTRACPLLEDLDLSDNSNITRQSLVYIISSLKKIRILSCNRCYGIDPNAYIMFNESQVEYLNIHGCISDSNMEMFLAYCTKLKVNKQIFNYTAKPNAQSMGSKQIWGQNLN